MTSRSGHPHKPIRVFLGLKEVAGHYRGLKEGFVDLGIPCTFINLNEHRFQYGGDDDFWLIRLIRRARKREPKAPRLLRWLKSPMMGLLFLWALWRHDVFIFGFNTSFFRQYRDLPILKFFGKKIVYQFHGSDSRPPYINGAWVGEGKNVSVAECIRLTREKKQELRAIGRYANVLIDIPPQGLFHERCFVMWLRVGLPNKREAPPSPVVEADESRPVRILHCPSSPEAKGTERVRAIVAQLCQEGLDVELVEIIGQPNHVVMAELARCDIVFDQVYADYGMPGLATEAAWFGKPVLIGGYAAPMWDAWLPEEARLPTCFVHPDALLETLRTLVTDESYRESVGRKARAFVESRWQPAQIAHRYLDLADGRIPEGWLYDPAHIRYWQGCAFPEEKVRELIRAVVETGGPEALQLEDKPHLKQTMLEAAYGAQSLVTAS